MVSHVFHTKHDFTPEFAWAAFQLLAQVSPTAISVAELKQIARITASALIRREDLHKLLGSMLELGLVERQADGYVLSAGGRSLEINGGRSASCFRAAVHCLYCWKWLWDNKPNIATPSWSYRAVCRAILDAGVAGVDQDDLVLRVIEAASLFGAERVSFSRSSVNGVAMWLEAQTPPLLHRKGSRLFAAMPGWVAPTTAQFHLGALCELAGGRAIVDSSSVRLLQESWLISAAGVMSTIRSVCELPGFSLVTSSPPQVLAHHGSILEWLFLVRAKHFGTVALDA